MQRFDYSNVGLQLNSLIGNPLFLPFLDKNISPAYYEYIPPPGDHYKLIFQTEKGGDWLAYVPHVHGLTGEQYLGDPAGCLKRGELARIIILDQRRLPFFGTSTSFDDEKLPFQEALDEGLIHQMSYQEAFENLGILSEFEKPLSEIPKHMNVVYQVLEKVDSAVDLKRFEGKKQKPKDSIISKIKKGLESLVPLPQMVPEYVH